MVGFKHCERTSAFRYAAAPSKCDLKTTAMHAASLTFDDLQFAASWHVQQPKRCAQVHRLLAQLQLTLVWLQGWFELAAGCLQDICQRLHGCHFDNMLLLCVANGQTACSSRDI
jgi:hypothetical protein